MFFVLAAIIVAGLGGYLLYLDARRKRAQVADDSELYDDSARDYGPDPIEPAGDEAEVFADHHDFDVGQGPVRETDYGQPVSSKPVARPAQPASRRGSEFWAAEPAKPVEPAGPIKPVGRSGGPAEPTRSAGAAAPAAGGTAAHTTVGAAAAAGRPGTPAVHHYKNPAYHPPHRGSRHHRRRGFWRGGGCRSRCRLPRRGAWRFGRIGRRGGRA